MVGKFTQLNKRKINVVFSEYGHSLVLSVLYILPGILFHDSVAFVYLLCSCLRVFQRQPLATYLTWLQIFTFVLQQGKLLAEELKMVNIRLGHLTVRLYR